MPGRRWSPEELASRISERAGQVTVAGSVGAGVLPVAAGAGRQGSSAPKGQKLKLSSERQDASADYLFQLKVAGLPLPEFEFKFHEERLWRADFAWPDSMLIVEYEGGIFTGGRHTRGVGYENDCHKYNQATLLGYRVIRITAGMVKSGVALEITERALSQ